ncbi:MAG: VWA domain-containing protein [Thermoanaerobaculia bacterium]|nr:VWA domain-containing protein [Thermoanaerobaculia bacterium]
MGGGNSAAETALDLWRNGVRVTLVHRRAQVKPSIKYWLKPDIENRLAEGSITARLETRVVGFEDGAAILAPVDERRAAARAARGRRRLRPGRLHPRHRARTPLRRRDRPRVARPCPRPRHLRDQCPWALRGGHPPGRTPDRPDLHRKLARPRPQDRRPPGAAVAHRRSRIIETPTTPEGDLADEPTRPPAFRLDLLARARVLRADRRSGPRKGRRKRRGGQLWRGDRRQRRQRRRVRHRQKGNRISGLKPSDFELTEDGKPVTITNFYAVEDGHRPGAAQAPTATQLPIPSAPTPVAGELEVPEEQQLHLIVYVDNFNLHPFTRNRTLGAVRTFLRSRLGRGDRVMLVTYDRSLHLRHPFTSDPELIASALYELEDITANAVHADSDRRSILEQIYEANDLASVEGRVSQYAESIFNDLSFSITALRDYVDMLAGLPGRKAILYVSDGLSMRAGEDVFYALEDRFRNSSVLMTIQRFDASRDFQQLTTLANANRVTFYTIDAAGLRTYTYMDVSNQTPLGGARIDQIYFTNLQSPLLMLAEETGGMAIVNTNNVAPQLDRIADDFRSYYSLGYSPAQTGTGRYRRLDVKLKDAKRNGWKVRHREGFRDKPVNARVSDTTLAALNFGYQSNPLGVRIEVAGMEPSEERDRSLVTLVLHIPIGKLSFLPQADQHRGRVRLFIAAKDTEGGVAPVQEVAVPIDIPAAELERAQSQFYQYRMQLLMRTGSQVVAIGVRDDLAAVTSVIARGLTVGP